MTRNYKYISSCKVVFFRLGDILYLDYSPQRVVLSGWVGDQDPTFGGLEQALKRYLQSAWAGNDSHNTHTIQHMIYKGYPNFGSDIGGYRSGNGTYGRTKELLIRWAQLGAFSPLMENGGNKEHRPWIFDNQTLDIYKKYDSSCLIYVFYNKGLLTFTIN